MNSLPEHTELFKALMNTVRSASRLYDHDIAFLRAADRTIEADSENQSQRLLSIVNRLVSSIDGGRNPGFKNVDDLIQRWSTVTQSIDMVVDKLDVALAGEHNSVAAANSLTTARQDSTPSPRKAWPRPQDSFDTPIDNSYGPFKPVLTYKHHAIIDLSESIKIQEPDEDHVEPWYDQPYAVEIATSHMPTSFYKGIPKKPKEPSPLEKSKYTWVKNPNQLRKLVSTLSKASEIAVDLEHHSDHSYLGLVSLMQISTRDEDWLIDTLALRTELQVLNSVFASPSIVKVLHGARMDIQWLQRDLGLYIVNLFDTHEAARELNHVRCGLANLLERYTGFVTNKKYQMADWRRRPLPTEMVKYARGDTHFLLYIYDRLRQELKSRKLLDKVVTSSKRIAGLRYEKPGYNRPGPPWVSVATRFQVRQRSDLTVMSKLWDWRDRLARKLDEGGHMIVTNRVLASLSLVHPDTAAAVLNIAPSLAPYVDEIVDAVKSAKEDISAGKLVELPLPPSRETGGEDVRDDDSPVPDRNDPEDNSRESSQTPTPPSNMTSSIPRLETPHIYGTTLPSFGHETHVSLGVFKTHELQQLGVPEDIQPQAADEEMEDAPKFSEEDNHVVPSEHTQMDKEPAASSHRNGKRINVVDSIDNAQSKLQQRQRSRKPKATADAEAEAFDFEKAAPVIAKKVEAEAATARNYSQFKRGGTRGRGGRGGGGPRGAGGPRRGRARSFR